MVTRNRMLKTRPAPENTPSARREHNQGLCLIALLEGAKGLIVLLAGFGLLAFIHHDAHEAAARLVRHLHLNPASHYPRIFLDLTEHISDTRLWALAGAALLYAMVRALEAVGLWLRKPWAEWFGVLTGGMYIPLELYEVTRATTWPRITVLVVNLVVVSYLACLLIRNSHKKET